MMPRADFMKQDLLLIFKLGLILPWISCLTTKVYFSSSCADLHCTVDVFRITECKQLLDLSAVRKITLFSLMLAAFI